MDRLIFIINLAVIIWLFALSFYYYKIASHYQRLVQKTGEDNLSDILDKILKNLGENQERINSLKKKIEEFGIIGKSHIQKVGILRYNPFSDTGGEQSFVLAILDGNDTGMVLTSLHTRGITRWYAKNVKEGKGVDHELSDEELKVIGKAAHLKSKRKVL